MARFQLKSLHSLVEMASGKIDSALSVEDVTARTRGLRAAQAENGVAFRRAARRQLYKMMGAGALAIVGGLTAALGIMEARSVFATLAGTTGYSIAVAIAGVFAFGLGVSFLAVAALNYHRIKSSWKSLNGKIDRAVSSVS